MSFHKKETENNCVSGQTWSLLKSGLFLATWSVFWAWCRVDSIICEFFVSGKWKTSMRCLNGSTVGASALFRPRPTARPSWQAAEDSIWQGRSTSQTSTTPFSGWTPQAGFLAQFDCHVAYFKYYLNTLERTFCTASFKTNGTSVENIWMDFNLIFWVNEVNYVFQR